MTPLMMIIQTLLSKPGTMWRLCLRAEGAKSELRKLMLKLLMQLMQGSQSRQKKAAATVANTTTTATTTTSSSQSSVQPRVNVIYRNNPPEKRSAYIMCNNTYLVGCSLKSTSQYQQVMEIIKKELIDGSLEPDKSKCKDRLAVLCEQHK